MPEYITIYDLQRWHAASRMIEDDLNEAYFTCRERYGPDIAGALLIFSLRDKLNDKKNQWPPPQDLIEKVNSWLADKGLVNL